MTGNFKMDDYVDVAERIRNFHEAFPQGSLQSELTRLESGWLCKAFAYRAPDDERPGIGHAFEPVPGKTPYTRDSEAMNAETSAWGRAIVALGFETKKIASAQEARARQQPPKAARPSNPAPEKSAAKTETGNLVDELKTLGATWKKLHPVFELETLDAWLAEPRSDEQLRRAIKTYRANIEGKLSAQEAEEKFPIPAGAKA